MLNKTGFRGTTSGLGNRHRPIRTALLAAIALLALSAAGCADDGVGAECVDETDCDTGLTCLVDVAFPGGYCTAVCDSAACPDGSECRDLSGLMICMRGCENQGDCREGYRCNGGVCDIPCSLNGDCADGEFCEEGECVDRCGGTPPLPLGCPCLINTECSSSACLTLPGGGVCTVPCTDEDECGAGLACGVVQEGSAGTGFSLGTNCVPENPSGGELGDPCGDDTDCRDTICFDNACSEVCTTCDVGFACMDLSYSVLGTAGTVPLCVEDGYVPAIIELGSIPTSAFTGSGDITFEIPPGVRSMAIVAETGATECAFPILVRDPNNVVWYNPNDGLADELDPNPAPRVLTMLVPDRDTSPPIATGTWTINLATLNCFNFMSIASSIERLAIYLKRNVGGPLDLNLHFTPASGVTAATAATNPWVSNFMARFWDLYGPMGFSEGTISYYDAPSTWNVIDQNLDLFQMCGTLSEPGPNGPALNVVIVGGFAGELMGAAGVSAGSPGAFMNDHVPSGCVAIEALTFNATIMGTDVAHEIGHFLSMQHTSEFGGFACGFMDPNDCYDNISDTGQCPNPTPTSFVCSDYTNIMYPTLNGVMETFSPGQELVLSGVPVARD